MVNRFSCACVALFAAGLAVSSTSASAACLAGVTTDEARQAFKAEPASLLRRYPFGSGGLSGEVRNFVASDTALIPVAIGLVGQANSRQKSAIAAGLAQAARACAISEQTAALAIQQAVAGLPDAELQTAFANDTGDTQTAAVGGEGAAAAPAGGGTAGSGGGGARQSIERSTPTTADSFSSSGGSGLFTGSSTNGVSALALNAVTPTSISGP